MYHESFNQSQALRASGNYMCERCVDNLDPRTNVNGAGLSEPLAVLRTGYDIVRKLFAFLLGY